MCCRFCIFIVFYKSVAKKQHIILILLVNVCNLLQAQPDFPEFRKDTSFLQVRRFLQYQRCDTALKYLDAYKSRLHSKDSFLLYQGEAEWQCELYKEAIEHLTAYLQSNAKNGKAYEILALCYYGIENHSMAQQMIDSAIVNDPRKFSKKYIHYGRVQLAAGYPKAAKVMLQKVLKENPDDEDAVALYAWAMMKSNQLPEAHKYLTEFLQTHPQSCQANYMMGRLLGEHMGVHESALTHLMTAADICKDSMSAEALLVVADLLVFMEDDEQALQAYDASLLKNPNQRTTLFNASVHKINMDLPKEAIQHLNDYLNLYGHEEDVHFQLGLAYELDHQYSKAIEQYTEALRMDSLYIDAWYNRGNVYRLTREFNYAIVDYTELLKIDGGYAEAWFNRAGVYFEIAEYRKAERDATNYLILNPKDAEGYYLRGNAKYYGDDKNGACADWNECLTLGRTDLWKKVKNICR